MFRWLACLPYVPRKRFANNYSVLLSQLINRISVYLFDLSTRSESIQRALILFLFISIRGDGDRFDWFSISTSYLPLTKIRETRISLLFDISFLAVDRATPLTTGPIVLFIAWKKRVRSFLFSFPLSSPPLFLSFSFCLSPTPFLVLSDYFALRRSIKSRCIVKVSRFSRACNEAVLSLPYIERFDLKAIALRRYATSRISSRVVHVLLCMSKVYAHLSSFHIKYK